MDINLNNVQHEPIVVTANLTAELNRYYVNTASATYTDPTPTQGKGFIVYVKNGTATVGGTGYSTVGTIIYRYYHSGAWGNTIVLDPSGLYQPLDADLTSIASLTGTSAYLRRSAANTYVLDSYSTVASNLPSTGITSKDLTGGIFPNSLFATTDSIIEAFQILDNLNLPQAFIVGDFDGTGGTTMPEGSIIVGSSTSAPNNVSLSLNATGGTFGLSGTGVLTMPNANTTTRGLLTSTDWNTFNGKQNALSSGINIKTVNGTSLLGSGDVGVGVTSVTGTSPISSSGGATPAISIAQSTTSTSGYLSSTDWNTFNGKQDALVSGTNIKTVDGNSLIGSGNLAISNSNLFSIYRSGQWLSGNTYTGLSAAAGWTIDRIRAIPFTISENVTLSGIRVEVTTNIASSKARLGIYSDSNGYPGSLLVDAGEVDCSTLGLKSIVISQALTKSMKRVWLAVNISHSTIGFRTGSTAVMILGRPTSGGTKVANSYMVTSTYGALPSTYPAGGAEEASAVNTFLIEAQIA